MAETYVNIAGQTYDVQELIGNPLRAKEPVALFYDSDAEFRYKLVEAGDLIGTVYSWVMGRQGAALMVDRPEGSYFVIDGNKVDVKGDAKSEEEKDKEREQKKLAFQWPDFIPKNWRVYITWGAVALLLLFVLGLLSRVLGFVKFSAFTKLFKKR